jgi:hypothetical protein
LSFLLAVVLSLPVFRAWACNCGREAYAPACHLISRAPVAFVGECLEIIPDPKGGKAPVYRFRVQRVFKGLDPNTTELIVNPDNFTSCATEYPTGKTYLIFGAVLWQRPLIVLAGACSGSRRADLNKADIDFLDKYSRGVSETAVYGKVLQSVPSNGRPYENESAPLGGAVVVLETSNNRFTSVSDSDGNFRFGGIPPGDYSLSARLDPYISDPPFYQISIQGGSCREEFIQLKAKSGIEGVLFTANGKPASRERVELLRRNRDGDWYWTAKMWTHTDEKGMFRFHDIESGDYLLGYEIWGDSFSNYSPYPKQYFPGVTDRLSATTITVGPREFVKGLKLTLPPPHTARKIKIKVIWPDGRPPGVNLLQIVNQRGVIRNLEGAQHGGVFSFLGYCEREYEFRARYWIDDLSGDAPVFSKRVVESDPVKLPAGRDEAKVVLVLVHQVQGRDLR